MLGGFTSIPGAIVGGLIIGAGEKLFEFFMGPLVVEQLKIGLLMF